MDFDDSLAKIIFTTHNRIHPVRNFYYYSSEVSGIKFYWTIGDTSTWNRKKMYDARGWKKNPNTNEMSRGVLILNKKFNSYFIFIFRDRNIEKLSNFSTKTSGVRSEISYANFLSYFWFFEGWKMIITFHETFDWIFKIQTVRKFEWTELIVGRDWNFRNWY